MAGTVADPEFLAELGGEAVPEDLVRWVAKKCGTSSLLANYVDDRSEVSCDPILTRIKSECDRGSPSVFHTQRVKSQAACGKKQPSKRVWINDEAALDIGDQTEEFVRVTSTLQYLAGLKLLMNGYSIFGRFVV